MAAMLCGRTAGWTQSFPTRYNDCNMTVVQTEAAKSARARTEGSAPFLYRAGSASGQTIFGRTCSCHQLFYLPLASSDWARSYSGRSTRWATSSRRRSRARHPRAARGRDVIGPGANRHGQDRRLRYPHRGAIDPERSACRRSFWLRRASWPADHRTRCGPRRASVAWPWPTIYGGASMRDQVNALERWRADRRRHPGPHPGPYGARHPAFRRGALVGPRRGRTACWTWASCPTSSGSFVGFHAIARLRCSRPRCRR